MDISTMFRISGAALGAQKQRLETIGENLAGANVTRTAEGGPYRRQEVVFRTFSDALSRAQGTDGPKLVKASVALDNRPFKEVYQPGHPDANEKGYVSMPNVNTMEEMVNMISASRAYEANIKVIGATRNMANKALEIGQ